MRNLFNDLRAFLMRGNVLDLAVAVVIGAAFGAIITSFTNDVLMQVIAAIGGEPDFSSLTFELGEGVIRYGAFLNTIVNFLIIGTAMFFVVRLAATLYRRRDAQVEAVEATEIALLTEIRDLLRERAT